MSIAKKVIGQYYVIFQFLLEADSRSGDAGSRWIQLWRMHFFSFDEVATSRNLAMGQKTSERAHANPTNPTRASLSLADGWRTAGQPTFLHSLVVAFSTFSPLKKSSSAKMYGGESLKFNVKAKINVLFHSI